MNKAVSEHITTLPSQLDYINISRHAYCIIVHTDLYCLQKLVECIDDYRNDIFIHIDKKSNMDLSDIKTRYSAIKILPYEKSYDVRWGTYSQVQTELELLNFAFENGKYSYFHLISGQDLPLHSQDYIHEYFHNLKRGTNLIGFKDYTIREIKNVNKRVTPFHFFKNYYRHRNKFVQYSCRIFEEMMNHIQLILGLKINYDIIYRKGCNWASIHHDFVEYVIAKRQYIDKILRKSIICDELLLQTLVWNSDFKDTVLDYQDEYQGCMREIDWKRGNPYTWRKEDFDDLIASPKLFARKFSSSEDKNIINMITSHVLNGNTL